MTSKNQYGRRILFAANTQWYLHNFRRETIAALIAEGHEVHCAAPRDDRRQALEELGATVHDSPPLPSRMSPFADARILAWYVGLFRRLRPATVFTFTPKPNVFAGIASRLTGTGFAPNVSGLGRVFERDNLLTKAACRAYSAAFGGAKKVIFQNRESRDMFVGKGIVSSGQAAQLAGSGVDLTRFAPSPLPASDPFVFLFSGRLVLSKGLAEFAQAARTIGDVSPDGNRIEYRIVGFTQEQLSSTMPRAELDALLQGSPARYCGPSDDVRDQMARAHCFVLPSYYGEGIPRSAIEAAACARPVITTDHPGCRETVIEGKTGFIAAPRDAVSLEQAMRKVLALDTAALSAMGAASRAHAEATFDVAGNIAAYAALTLDRDMLSCQN
ncbi:glycosyltransferase family 4 protein [Altererythrobacter sp. MTPC7]|uniref:glycosyltransferase family 4 protein n=1 Tax=Altererythrobacter sp. MTPC7 TaxID=3056567 RepID=UPI0036F1B0CB